MGSAEPLDPQDEGTRPTDAAPSRADWLCGPEEGLEAERERLGESAASIPAPKLIRPGGGEGAVPPPPARVTPRPLSPSPVAGPAAAPAPIQAPIAPGRTDPDAMPLDTPQAWTAAASSVPRLRREERARPAAIETMRGEFPMDDVDERRSGEPAAAAPAAPEVTVVAPSEFQVAENVVWWKAALELLRTNRIAQLCAGGAVLVLITLALMPRGPKSMPVKDIRANAQRWDGVAVHVRGRVGEVFPVGGGYAYYLVQGRDTIVVFTRANAPNVRSTVSVNGTVSTGVLDGQTRVAIFEEDR